MSEPLAFGAPVLGPHIVPEAPQPGPVVSLSASERSHRHRLVVEATEAVQIDDDVARLIARRKAAVALAAPPHVDTAPARAAEQVERLLRARQRAAAEPLPLVESAPEPARSTVPPPPLNPEPWSSHPSADDIAALGRARKAQVSTAGADEVPLDAASDVSRLLARRSSEV